VSLHSWAVGDVSGHFTYYWKLLLYSVSVITGCFKIYL